MTTKTKLIAGLLILLAAFLIGFVPQYMGKVRLRDELLTSRLDLRMAELRDLCGMMLLEVQGQNYGLAREFSTQYFEKVRQVAEDVPDPLGQPLRELLTSRDSLNALLAQADPASSSHIQMLCRRTYQASKR
jgi:hypothetical protein